VDLRDELAKGNRSIISRKLYDSMDAAFKSGEQVMLFINRRGYNSFVSCRSCGEVIRCPRCDVSLSLHETYNSRKLICHYCGHTENSPTECPKCHSKLIGGYGTGTQKLEEEVKKLFPSIRTLRMDKDTTSFFFTNFLEEAQVVELWSLFAKHGRVGEVYVPNKRDKHGNRFGFVKFKEIKSLEALTARLEDVWMGTFRLRINLSLFGRNKRRAVPFQSQSEGGDLAK
jgi:hypothetical protein